MLQEFVSPVGVMLDENVRERIALLSKRGLSFLELVYSWAGELGGRVSFVRLPEEDGEEPSVAISLEYRGESVAIAVKTKSELVSAWGRYQPLNEQMIRLADDDLYVPDPQWQEQRNHKLKVHWSDRHECMVMPVRNLVRIVLSYALSSRGMVHIDRLLHEDCYYRIRSYYCLTCVFLTDEPQCGWAETIHVEEARLEKCHRRSIYS